MSTEVQSAADWLEQAAVPEASLTPAQQQLLHNACGFLQEAGTDYYSRRFLSHFLLPCRADLTTAACPPRRSSRRPIIGSPVAPTASGGPATPARLPSSS